MFGLGGVEFLLVLLVIVIVVKPSDLPKFVYKVGQLYGQMREAYNQFVSQIREMEWIVKKQVEAEIEAERLRTLEEDRIKESSDATTSTTDANQIVAEGSGVVGTSEETSDSMANDGYNYEDEYDYDDLVGEQTLTKAPSRGERQYKNLSESEIKILKSLKRSNHTSPFAKSRMRLALRTRRI